MLVKSKNINKIQCLAVAFLTLCVLPITAWAQTDVVTDVILFFESEGMTKEVTVAKGTAEPNLPHTLRAVTELAEIQFEVPGKLPAVMADKPQEPVSKPSDADEPSDAESEPSESEETSAEPEQRPNFVPAEPNDLCGYETANGSIYTYTDVSGEISYRIYGSFNGSDLAWFACDESGGIFGIIKEIPVTWACVDYDKETPGTYRFTAEFEGYSYDGEPLSAIVILVADESAPAKSIGGKLWLDENADGVMEESETGIANYPVSLYAEGDMGTAVQATQTQADGSYRFENLEPGSYQVGIASEAIEEVEYLLPVAGISGDNKFALMELDEETIIACSESITVLAETDTAVETLHAGVRPAEAHQVAAALVNSAQSFIQAVNDNSTWEITLDADIVIEYGMTDGSGRWNSNYQSPAQPGYAGQPQGILVGNKSNAGGNGSFIIDGQNQYKIIFKWPHTIVEGGNFYFPVTNSVKEFTMRNLTWYGSSEVGCYFPVGNTTNGVRITFDSVTYKGPGMGDIAIYSIYHPQVLFKNCDITMSYRNGSGGGGVDSDGYGGSLPASGLAPHGALWQDTHASETIAANFIAFEGSNTISKQDAPADGGGVIGDIDPIFYIYWGGDSYVKVADGASLIIYDEAGKTKQSVYTTGLIGTHTSAYSTPFSVGKNAVFEYHHVGGGNGFITDYYKLGSFTIGDNASVVFDIKADTKFTSNDASSYPAYFTADAIHVGKGASWTYVADYALSAAGADNSMISANTISVAEGANVNIIARNNSKAESLITLRDSGPGISFTAPQTVVLFNSKSGANTYVIKSSSNASLSIKTNTIRSWLLESGASMAGTIAFGNQTALIGNYITDPNPAYQWALNDEQYSATLSSGTNSAIANFSQGHGDIFNLSGTRTLKNINVLELRAAILPMDFVFYKENESGQALSGVKFELYPQNIAGTGWDMSGAIAAASATDGRVLFEGLGTGEYLLTEVEAAPGYMLPAGQWKVSVNAAAKTITISSVPDGNGVFPPAFITEGGIKKLLNYKVQQVAVTISKIVSGDYADFAKTFTFTIRFWNADGTPFTGGTQLTYTGGIIPGSGATVQAGGTLTLDGNGQATFTLKHGQTITFPAIPVNSRVQIIETTDVNYEPSFKDSEDVDATSSPDTGVRILTGNRTFEFTNTRFAIVPTGILAGNTYGLELLALSMLLLGGVLSTGRIYRKRKEIK